jgi:putative restriction endonuclease
MMQACMQVIKVVSEGRGNSIVQSVGYVDDRDDGDLVIYTGQGGRDPNSGRQIADQALTRGNKQLAHHYN